MSVVKSNIYQIPNKRNETKIEIKANDTTKVKSYKGSGNPAKKKKKIGDNISDSLIFNPLEKEILKTKEYTFNMTGMTLESVYGCHRRFQNSNHSDIYRYRKHAEDLPIYRRGGGIHRAGIIPWKSESLTWSDKEKDIWFIFGVDAISGDITDFGGTHEYTKDTTLLDTAVREYQEEVYDAPGIDVTKINESLGILYRQSKTLDVFPEYSRTWPEICKIFFENRENDKKFEVIDLLFISKRQLITILTKSDRSDNFSFYSKIYQLLNKHIDIIKRIGNTNDFNESNYKNRGTSNSWRKKKYNSGKDSRRNQWNRGKK